jgi:hypothetical protein
MKNNERFWRISEIVLGAMGAALLAVILVLKLLGHDITTLTYPMVGILLLFLICDEFARSIRRRQEKEKEAQEQAEHPLEPEHELPTEAFDFDEPSDAPSDDQ